MNNWSGIFKYSLIREGEVVASGEFPNQAHNFFLGSMQLLALKGPTTVVTAPTTFHIIAFRSPMDTPVSTTYGGVTYAYNVVTQGPAAIASIYTAAPDLYLTSLETPDTLLHQFGRAWNPTVSAGQVTGSGVSWTISSTLLSGGGMDALGGVIVASDVMTPQSPNVRMMASGIFSWASITTLNTVILQPIWIQHGDVLNVDYSFKIT